MLESAKVAFRARAKQHRDTAAELLVRYQKELQGAKDAECELAKLEGITIND
jgi:translation initiation factor IF-3